MESKDQKVIFKYLYIAGLALCLLHAAFVVVTFPPVILQGNVGHISVWQGDQVSDFNPRRVIRIVWWTLFLSWPLWLVALVGLWFFGDRRKLWRLFVPIGLGIMFIVIPILLIALFLWALGHGSLG